MAWHINGEYFENCNCDVLCPCITSSLQGKADQERCYVSFAIHIEDGASDSVRLDGLNAVLVMDSPQVMGTGGWRLAAYLDERATDEQRAELGAVLSGERGGPPELVKSLIGEQLGVKSEIEEIDASGAAERLDSVDPPVFLDVREQDEADQGVIAGAVHIPRGNLESRVEQALPDKSAPVVVYCAGGSRSAFAAKTLE